jgi:NAD(P)-dependent dehydrogenase (short-subunit alcohol dehydrogenase family)
VGEISGQVALITGASSGIGLHLARGLAERGMAVAGLARSADRLREAMAEVGGATGARALAVPCDVTDRTSVEAAVAHVTEELGNVDLLVNNAGLIDAAEVPLWEADPDQWWHVVASHVQGTFLLCRAVVPWMLLRNRGRIVTIASGQSVRVNPVYSAYGVAKTGLMRITEALDASLEGSDVATFDLAPGVVDTPMTRSMSMWEGRTDWTPPERVVEFVAAIAAGELDQWSGRLLRVGADEPAAVGRLRPEGDARRLRLRPYGDDDPLRTP